MTWGFEATNRNGQVLVSSDTRNLHFLGKATLDRIIRQNDGYGGFRHYAFRIDCMVTPVPFFTAPTADRYGIVAIRNVSATVWEIEVLRSGVSATIPEVYVFCDPRGMINPPTTDYGMQVMRDDNTPSFDSRFNPLIVTGGIQVAPPSNPLTVTPPTLTARFCGGPAADYLGPNNENTYPVTTGATKPIFFYPSIAQAQRQFHFYEEEQQCDGINYGVCIGFSRAYEFSSDYWAFYRGGIRSVGGYIFAGWVTAEFGCNWWRKESKTLIEIIGLGDKSSVGGVWPYSNETLNLAPTAVIISDGSFYD